MLEEDFHEALTNRIFLVARDTLSSTSPEVKPGFAAVGYFCRGAEIYFALLADLRW
jgi:hypothetical protein